MNVAVVGVGSNIDAENNVNKAKALLELEHIVSAQSRMVRTEPVGFKEQPDFLNGAFLIETKYSFNEFILSLKAVESKCGRVRTRNKYGPRTIDLDVVVWNNKIIDDEYYSRSFLKNAVEEVLPELRK